MILFVLPCIGPTGLWSIEPLYEICPVLCLSQATSHRKVWSTGIGLKSHNWKKWRALLVPLGAPAVFSQPDFNQESRKHGEHFTRRKRNGTREKSGKKGNSKNNWSLFGPASSTTPVSCYPQIKTTGFYSLREKTTANNRRRAGDRNVINFGSK